MKTFGLEYDRFLLTGREYRLLTDLKEGPLPYLQLVETYEEETVHNVNNRLFIKGQNETSTIVMISPLGRKALKCYKG